MDPEDPATNFKTGFLHAHNQLWVCNGVSVAKYPATRDDRSGYFPPELWRGELVPIRYTQAIRGICKHTVVTVAFTVPDPVEGIVLRPTDPRPTYTRVYLMHALKYVIPETSSGALRPRWAPF